MIVNIHKHDGKVILAVCDNDLIGKKFIEDGKQLDLTSVFYKGKEMQETELRMQLKKAYILNIIGTESVEFALSEGVISKENIIKIKNIPHAQALLIRE